jgi:predicted Na+-dependent transporter
MSQLDPFLIAVGTLGVLVFIVTSMFGMGSNLTIPQIMAPLKNTRLVLLELIANFIVVPILTLLIVRIVPLSEGLQIGLILAGFAAGAPFLPKLIQVSKGDMAFTAGIMVVLMVLTVAYMPIVLPFVLTGVEVCTWDIGKSLIFLMLIPLGIALFIRARYEEALSMVVLFIGYFVGYFSEIIGIIGTGGIISAILLIVSASVVGFLAEGKSMDSKKVLALPSSRNRYEKLWWCICCRH